MEAGEDLLKVEETNPGKNLLLSLDRSNIATAGVKAIKNLFVKITGELKFFFLSALLLFFHVSYNPVCRCHT